MGINTVEKIHNLYEMRDGLLFCLLVFLLVLRSTCSPRTHQNHHQHLLQHPEQEQPLLRGCFTTLLRTPRV
ncbi:uncharacterized protein B0P05DRAFT_563576 [Gilbertella persicaria]|uniref:uncharacterized protein n=1 Tax=Gilbertella persicaria TaxID=101096 RepID=UPI00221F15DF|nr:uncharacterized protein B0P05DRAFT_563576 [Gilbertella persicaria]KAI8049824.1 hypothetical protein B0P05DRAFT_563576 [Gilbertella persicaria]